MSARKGKASPAGLAKVRRSRIRDLLAKGEIEEAGMLCAEWGIDIEDCKLVAAAETLPELVKEKGPEIPPPDMTAAAPPLPSSPDTPPAPIQSRWPAEADVVVTAQPINPRMSLIRLEDGRRAMMWKRGSTFPVHAKVRVRLCDQVGPDAYYEPAVA